MILTALACSAAVDTDDADTETDAAPPEPTCGPTGEGFEVRDAALLMMDADAPERAIDAVGSFGSWSQQSVDFLVDDGMILHLTTGSPIPSLWFDLEALGEVHLHTTVCDAGEDRNPCTLAITSADDAELFVLSGTVPTSAAGYQVDQDTDRMCKEIVTASCTEAAHHVPTRLTHGDRSVWAWGGETATLDDWTLRVWASLYAEYSNACTGSRPQERMAWRLEPVGSYP